MKNSFQFLMFLAIPFLFVISGFAQQPCLQPGSFEKVLKQIETGKSPAIDKRLKQELLSMRDAYISAEIFGTDDIKKVDEDSLIPQAIYLWLSNGYKVKNEELINAFLSISVDSISGGRVPKGPGQILAKLKEQNAARLCEIVNSTGWPTVSMAGIDGSNAMLYLMRTNMAPALQEKLFKIVTAGVERGEIAKSIETAAFFDRVLVNKNLNQLFGTQGYIAGQMVHMYPTENLKFVAKNREAYGLRLLSEHVKRLEGYYQMPSVLDKQGYRFISNAGWPAELKTPPRSPDLSGKEDEDVVKVNSELVNLDLRIFDPAEKFRDELQAKDFAVFEEGVRQEISFFSSTDAPFDLLLLVDVSSSTNEKAELLVQTTKQFIDRKRKTDRVAIIEFARNVKLISLWTDDAKTLRQRAETIQSHRPGTNLWIALKAALSIFEKKETGRRKAMVVLTDGADIELNFSPTPNPGTPFAEVMESIRNAGVPVFPVYLDTEKDFDDDLSYLPGALKWYQLTRLSVPTIYGYARNTLALMAEESGGHYYKAEKLKDLESVYGQVLDDLGKVYTIGYAPARDAPDGSWRSVKVEVNGHPELIVFTKPGYYSKPPP
jgi:VWFA-related protein